MTTAELSSKTGVPASTLKLWVREGILRPAVTGYGKGRGNEHVFDDDNVAQAIAIAKIKELFGDGRAAHQALAEAVPQVRLGVPAIRFSAFELSLA